MRFFRHFPVRYSCNSCRTTAFGLISYRRRHHSQTLRFCSAYCLSIFECTDVDPAAYMRWINRQKRVA